MLSCCTYCMSVIKMRLNLTPCGCGGHKTSPIGVYLTICIIRHTLRHVDRHSEANLLQHQVLVSDLDLSPKIESKNTLYGSGGGIIITYPDGGFVSLHTVCSLILPSDHNGGHTTVATQLQTTIQTRAPRSHTNTAGCPSIWPRMDDLVHICSGHLVRKRANRAQQVLKWPPHRQSTTLPPFGCMQHPSSLPRERLFSAFWLKGRQAITEPSQQLPSACWNDPPASLLDINMTHSRASGNQRESFELYTESGLKSPTHGRWNLLLTFAVIFFSVEMHDSSYHVLI